MSDRVDFRLQHVLTGLFMDCRTPGKSLVHAESGQRVTLQRRKRGVNGEGQRFYMCPGNLNTVYNKYGLVLTASPLEDILMLGGEPSDAVLHFNNDGRIGVDEKHVRLLVPDGQPSAGSLIVVKESNAGLKSPEEVWKKVPCGGLASKYCVCM